MSIQQKQEIMNFTTSLAKALQEKGLTHNQCADALLASQAILLTSVWRFPIDEGVVVLSEDDSDFLITIAKGALKMVYRQEARP